MTELEDLPSVGEKNSTKTKRCWICRYDEISNCNT